MNQTHTSYKLSKALKEFLGDSAPEPMGLRVWAKVKSGPAKGDVLLIDYMPGVVGIEQFPAYQLHDLLSKPFCEAMANARAKIVFIGKGMGKKFNKRTAEIIAHDLLNRYYDGGLPAVEAELFRMMEAKS